MKKNCPAYPVSWFGIRVGAFYDSLLRRQQFFCESLQRPAPL